MINLSFSPLQVPSIFKHQWYIVGGALLAGLAISTCGLLITEPKYQVQAYLDFPHSNSLTQLNLGRSSDSGLTPYAPEKVYEYFTRRLVSDGAIQRFFKETYLPAQSQPPHSLAAEQALFIRMKSQILRITPPSPKGRMQYSIQVTTSQGAEAAQWALEFLAQVEQDAREALRNDMKQSISLQIQNTERDWQERLRTTQIARQDRLAQLHEALLIAQATGQHEPQITRVQPPRQDGLTPYMDGSQLYARGTKSLLAEIDVLKHRKDDAPFMVGLRAAEGQLRLLKEIQNTERNFSTYHIDGQISAPEQPQSPKPVLFLFLGTLLGGLLGTMVALWREGIVQSLLRDERDDGAFPALAPAGLSSAVRSNPSMQKIETTSSTH